MPRIGSRPCSKNSTVQCAAYRAATFNFSADLHLTMSDQALLATLVQRTAIIKKASLRCEGGATCAMIRS